MKIISNKDHLIKYIHKEKNLGFVPTMGALHHGHISLIKNSLTKSDKTIVSIFINRPQFNRKNDYAKYPRKIQKDILILKKLKVHYLYLPKNNQIYPFGPRKNIKINSFGKKLCGKSRPRHFEAITDVVERFIKLIKPKKIYFGEKDMQQLMIITDFVEKNYSKIKIIPCKTIREKNGIACSSRNLLLSSNEKKIASKIYKLLFNNKNKIIQNIYPIKLVKNKIKNLGVKKIDYLKVLDINKIIRPYKKNKRYKIFIAYFLGSTRLIDNI